MIEQMQAAQKAQLEELQKAQAQAQATASAPASASAAK